MTLLDEMKDEQAENQNRKRFGLYKGIVRDVDDPEGRGRIRIEIHELLGKNRTSAWASYCAPFGGGGSGFFMLPHPGDGVWVMFEQGDPSKPVWIGFWFNVQDPPPEDAGQDVRMLQSKSGHRIVFGDEAGKEYIEIRDMAENIVRMDAVTGNLTIKTEGTLRLDAPEVETTHLTHLAGKGRRVARVSDVVISRGHKRQVGYIRTGAAKTTAG